MGEFEIPRGFFVRGNGYSFVLTWISGFLSIFLFGILFGHTESCRIPAVSQVRQGRTQQQVEQCLSSWTKHQIASTQSPCKAWSENDNRELALKHPGYTVVRYIRWWTANYVIVYYDATKRVFLVQCDG